MTTANQSIDVESSKGRRVQSYEHLLLPAASAIEQVSDDLGRDDGICDRAREHLKSLGEFGPVSRRA